MITRELELWAGPECTVNRVGDAFFDQVAATGHAARDDDLTLLASLPVAALRYPLLWERIQPSGDAEPDWAWTDRRLAGLRERGIRPIAGLVHHGSGPLGTDLLSHCFARGLATHARASAERYPWIRDWTPVNEPLTTARFSALYGHWYPHKCDERAFWLALLNQVDATRAAMVAIRAVIPDARLIQTDDLGRTYATEPLRDQAAFDNTRRWMGWDLLCGRVDRRHPFWNRLARFGLADRLAAITDAPCPPDIIGINHYLTSDRFLDHRLGRYPPDAHGGNGECRYADVAAARVLDPRSAGIRGAISEAWARYRIPIALTEVHNGCTRDEQMRWFGEAWECAARARDSGIDVVAVTAWSVFGSVGWDRLLTGGGHRETGVFDVRGETPRATALSHALKMARHRGAPPPGAAGRGWWTRPIRFHHHLAIRAAPMRDHPLIASPVTAQPILITGATGTLGQAVARCCDHRDLAYVLTTRSDLELSDHRSISAAIAQHRPWAVINCAGWVRVPEAEHEAEACFAVNAAGAVNLARACAEGDIPCLSVSSDLVFSGYAGPYDEKSATSPTSVYGKSKAAMERAIVALGGPQLIIRTAAFFSPFDPHNFAAQVVARIAAGEPFEASEDRVTPTYVPHLCDAMLDLLIDQATGIFHLTGGEAVSWLDFARRIAVASLCDVSLVAARDPAGSSRRDNSLASRHGLLLPSLDKAIGCFARGITETALTGGLHENDVQPGAPPKPLRTGALT